MSARVSNTSVAKPSSLENTSECDRAAKNWNEALLLFWGECPMKCKIKCPNGGLQSDKEMMSRCIKKCEEKRKDCNLMAIILAGGFR